MGSSKQNARTVVFAEAADPRVLRAAAILRTSRKAIPILAGNEAEIRSVAADHDLNIDGLRIADPGQDDRFDELVDIAAAAPKPFSPEVARKMLRQPLLYGTALVCAGRAHALIAGAAITTAEVIRAGLGMFGTEEGIATASSYFLMRIPALDGGSDTSVIFADCAVNVNPTPERLADIVIVTESNARHLLDDEPRVAMLSFSSKGSASHEMIDKVVQAMAIVRERRPDIVIDGELQFDAAYSSRVASLKLSEAGPVAGRANVFIFPDLNSGNIGYKIAQYLAGAKAVGPILQGFAFPISDLSRGATVDDIVETTELLLATS